MMDKDKCWNGGKTNTSLELKQEVKVDKIEQEKLWERIKNQINDFEHKYTKPTEVSWMGGVQRIMYRTKKDKK